MNVMSEGGDIQRGDHVYYEGEVWKVSISAPVRDGSGWVAIVKGAGTSAYEGRYVAIRDVQRVERVQ